MNRFDELVTEELERMGFKVRAAPGRSEDELGIEHKAAAQALKRIYDEMGEPAADKTVFLSGSFTSLVSVGTAMAIQRRVVIAMMEKIDQIQATTWS